MKKPGKRTIAVTLLIVAALVVIMAQNGEAFIRDDTPAASSEPEPAFDSAPPAPEPEPEQEAELPEEAIIEIEGILQLPELPNGREGTSLAMVLQWIGYDVDKIDVCYNVILREEFRWEGNLYLGANPEYAYPGDPAATGYYCFPPAVTVSANQYLRAQGDERRARVITGATEDELMALLAEGHPVILWKTLDHQPLTPRPEQAWVLSDTSEVYVPYANVHVVVLHGYAQENFYVLDPLGEIVTLPRATLMEDYERMGSRAVVIK